ncbi:MAG: carboxypeptidase regulatory-like domain-containing protein [Acidobacteria bacterium]|nr:carboxypeptidase regulatory-like domain-containing protein [Acidobacteriota bacterium]
MNLRAERLAALVLVCAVGPGGRAAAQALPAGPVVVGGGRVTIRGEVSVSAGPEDTGFYNDTDYRHSTLRLLRLGVAAARRPAVAALGAPPPRGPSDLPRAVVCLESAPRGAFEASEGGGAVMDQRNETFVPHVLAIPVGTVVQFPNSDRIYHNVFSLPKPARFDLGRYALGRSKPVRFDRPGVVRVFCDVHSHMSAFILVFGHPFCAVTDADGRYRIDGVPPGTCQVAAWHEGETSRPQPAEVPDGGAAEVDFTLR